MIGAVDAREGGTANAREQQGDDPRLRSKAWLLEMQKALLEARGSRLAADAAARQQQGAAQPGSPAPAPGAQAQANWQPEHAHAGGGVTPTTCSAVVSACVAPAAMPVQAPASRLTPPVSLLAPAAADVSKVGPPLRAPAPPVLAVQLVSALRAPLAAPPASPVPGADAAPAASATDTDAHQFTSRQMHLQQGDDAVHAWVRDASLSQADAYRVALTLVHSDAERNLLHRRLTELSLGD